MAYAENKLTKPFFNHTYNFFLLYSAQKYAFFSIANKPAEPRGEAGEAAAHKTVCTRGLVRAVGRKKSRFLNALNKEPLLTCVNKELLISRVQ